MLSIELKNLLYATLDYFPPCYATQKREFGRFLLHGKKTAGSALAAPLASRAVNNGMVTALALIPTALTHHLETILGFRALDALFIELSELHIFSGAVINKLHDILLKAPLPLLLKKQAAYQQLFELLLNRLSSSSAKQLPSESLPGHFCVLHILTTIACFSGPGSNLFIQLQTSWNSWRYRTLAQQPKLEYFNNLIATIGGELEDNDHLTQVIFNSKVHDFRMGHVLLFSGGLKFSPASTSNLLVNKSDFEKISQNHISSSMNYTIARLKSSCYSSESRHGMELTWLDFCLSMKAKIPPTILQDLSRTLTAIGEQRSYTDPNILNLHQRLLQASRKI